MQEAPGDATVGRAVLKYEPVRVPGLVKPFYTLRDHQELLWVDARSAVELLGLAWTRWAQAIRVRRTAWGAEDCNDRNGRETTLIPAARFSSWLAEMGPSIYYKPAQQRHGLLRNAWRSTYQEQQRGSAASSPDAVRKRKITAQTVDLLYAARQEKLSWAKSAAKAGVSLTAARQIAGDTYPHLPDDARLAWERTFGADFVSR